MMSATGKVLVLLGAIGATVFYLWILAFGGTLIYEKDMFWGFLLCACAWWAAVQIWTYEN